MPKQQLSIKVGQEDGISIVSLDGAVDASNVRDFEAALKRACGAERPLVLVDCEHLSYVNSTSFGILFTHHTACEKRGGMMVFCGFAKKIQSIIKILGLEQFLNLQKGYEDGMKVLQSKA